MKTNRFQELINRLELFIVKYYKNKILKGIIYLVFLTSFLYGVFVFLEDVFYFPPTFREILFFTFLSAFFIQFFILIVWPFIQITKVVHRRMSYNQAAEFVGKYFQDISDSLINTISLNSKIDEDDDNIDLVIASINQRIDEIKPFDFREAIDFKSNFKYLHWALIPLVVVLLIAIVWPNKVLMPTKRIMHYKQQFEKPQDFYFYLNDKNLSCLQNDDYNVICSVIGDEIPDKVYIIVDGKKMLMREEANNSFSFVFKALQEDFKFYFEAKDIESERYLLKVNPVPNIIEFETAIEYPKYTNVSDKILKNTGDMYVPQGSYITWNYFTKDVDGLKFIYGEKDTTLFTEPQLNKIVFRKKFLTSTNYKIVAFNKYTFSKDTLNYHINVIKDAFPQIEIEQFDDSISVFKKYFTGYIRDDYGFSKMMFVCGNNGKFHYQEHLSFNKKLVEQEFFHYVDFDAIGAKAGDNMEYYFIVYDNDAVNGPKYKKSNVLYFNVPTEDEIFSEKINRSNEIRDIISKGKNDAKKIKESAVQLKRKLIEKGKLDWNDKKLLKELIQKNEEVKKTFDKAIQKMEDAEKFEEQFEKREEEIVKKQDALEKLMKEVLDDEFMKLLEELRALMEKMNQDNENEVLEKLEMSSENLEENLDRSLELFKKLAFEKELNEAMKLSEKILTEQKDLSEQADKTSKSKLDTLSSAQKRIQEQYESLKKKIDSLDKKNSDLEQKTNFSKPENMDKSLDEEFEKSIENIQNQRKSKTSKNQDNLIKKLSSIKKDLFKFKQNMEQKDNSEDVDNIKQLLENIVDISLEQENLLLEFSFIRKNDPRYVKKVRDQYVLKQEISVVKDSLQCLAKRQMAIQPFILKEIRNIDADVEKCIINLNDHNVSKAVSRQQYVMTHLNDLALFLNEVLDQMNKNLNSNGQGGGKSKSKESKPSMSELRKQQQQLQKQMQQMKNGNMPNKKHGKGKQSMSEGLARLAAKQAAIRRQMEELREDSMKDGVNDKGLNEIIKKMELNEVDLVNKRLTDNLIRRQKQIETRMLKSERAIAQREKEKKREAKEIKNHKISNSIDILEYKRIRNKEREIIKTIPPQLTPEYRKKVNVYLLESK